LVLESTKSVDLLGLLAGRIGFPLLLPLKLRGPCMWTDRATLEEIAEKSFDRRKKIWNTAYI